MKLISFVIPVYRNQGSIAGLHKSIREDFGSNFPDLSYEMIFVNDGSDDHSLDEIMKLREKDHGVKVVSFSRNFGQMSAILAGWHLAKGDAVINISADAQEPVELFTNMIREWLEGFEVVIGKRISRQDPLVKRFSSRIFYGLMKLSIPQIPIGGFDITLMDRKALDAINSFSERGRFYQANILWVGFNIKYVPYKRLKREHGSSQNTFSKMFRYTVNAYLNVSYFPIRFMSVFGMITALIGFLYAAIIVHAYFFDEVPFQGWAPIMVLLLIIGGMLMLMLGIIGEYIWRILDETKNRPHYIIKEIHE